MSVNVTKKVIQLSDTRVVNKYKEPYDVYIGRGSPVGNPFSHKEGTKASYKVETREEAVEYFEHYIRKRIEHDIPMREYIMSLKGKTLGCFCKPQACHGDVIVKIIEELSSEH